MSTIIYLAGPITGVPLTRITGRHDWTSGR